MTAKLSSLFLFALALHFAFSVVRADDKSFETETRLRDALRGKMQELRDAQNEAVTLQAARDQADKDNAELRAKVDALTTQIANLTTQSATDKAAADKALDELKTQVADQAGQIERLNQSLAEWKKAQEQATQLATAKEEARAKLALQAALLQRTVEDREIKNLELYKLGSEILTRYEKFGLGDAIGAKEPFVGLSRVKLESMVQAYRDKLLDQTVVPGQPPAAVPRAASAARPAVPASETPAKT